jgi:phosphatidylserine decarboxylase
MLVQAKGRTYSAAALLDDTADAGPFEGGAFLTLYLSPRDYHRIHSPATGSVAWARHVPGALMPVNRAAVASIADLFPRNERVIAMLNTPAAGRVAVVAVGAYNVGRNSTAFDPAWASGPVSNRPGARRSERRYDPPVRVERGDEIMAFHLGSTAVLLFEPGRFALAPSLRSGARIRLGEVIGTGSPK